jgi:hypothetical protein
MTITKETTMNTLTRDNAIAQLRSIESQEEMLFVRRNFELIGRDDADAQLDALYERRCEIRRQHSDITRADVAVDRRKAQRRTTDELELSAADLIGEHLGTGYTS